MQQFDYKNIENKLRLLLNKVDTLTLEERAEAMHLLEMNEFGLALEALFEMLCETRIALSSEVTQLIEELASDMCIQEAVDVTKLRR